MAIRTNLVPDPRFNSGNEGNYWGNDSDYSFVSTGGFIDGGYVLQVSTANYANFTTVNDSNGIPVLASTNYTCSFYYNPVSVVGNTPHIQINVGSAFGTNLLDTQLNPSGGWQQFSTSVNTGANTLLYFRIYNNNSAVTFYYSNFQVELTANAGAYFDGSFPATDTNIYAWTGSADNSASTATPNIASNFFPFFYP